MPTRSPTDNAEDQQAGRCLPSTEQYKARNVGERWFSRLKQFRAVVTRFDKLAARYVAGFRLASLIL